MEDYSSLAATLRALTEGDGFWLCDLANASAAIYAAMPDLNWAGFYLLRNDALILGPFQGKPACIRIQMGRGVCGTAAATRQTQRVANVHEFPGHIACDGASNSEIVVPLIAEGRLLGVLDLDSPKFDRFSPSDQVILEECAQIIAQAIKNLEL